MIRLVIATPVDGNAVTGQYSAGYLHAVLHLMRDNPSIEHLPAELCYSADIVRARNRCSWKVLRDMPDATHVLWWDSDVVPRDLSIVSRMLATSEHVIAAPYLRKGPGTWTHMGDPDANGHVMGVGFGFTITSTGVLLAMSSMATTYTDFLSDGSSIDGTPDIFDLRYGVHPDGRKMKLSEDFSFCQRWRELGGHIALYTGPGSVLSHVGNHAYTPSAKGC